MGNLILICMQKSNGIFLPVSEKTHSYSKMAQGKKFSDLWRKIVLSWIHAPLIINCIINTRVVIPLSKLTFLFHRMRTKHQLYVLLHEFHERLYVKCPTSRLPYARYFPYMETIFLSCNDINLQHIESRWMWKNQTFVYPVNNIFLRMPITMN